MQTWLSKAPRADMLLPQTCKAKVFTEIIRALRRFHTSHQLRSLRKGALCTMARNGTPTDTLLVFSGHASTITLLKYLNRGQALEDRAVKGALAAQALHPRVAPLSQ